MKLGIMTWFHYRNYGTVLQAVALTAKLRTLGVDPFIVNYIPSGYFRSVPDYRFSKILKRFTKKESLGVNYFKSTEKESCFDSFLNTNVKFTSKCEDLSDLETLNNEFDGFICGSDQIWSPLSFNPHYFLDFVRNPDKKISYAPSFGVNEIEDLYIKKQVKEHLSDFKYLSVREEAGEKIIDNLISKKAAVVLDPTLLLTNDEWQSLFNLKEKHSQPYLIAYMLGQDSKHWDEIYRLSEQMKLEVKVIPVYEEDLKRKGCLDFCVGPQEFLELIYNASYICTDSFHGVAFSVNFQKQFTAFKRFKKNDSKNQNSRVLHLLNSLDLTNTLYNDKDILSQLNDHIDYNLVENKLKALRDNSVEFLKLSLSSLDGVSTINPISNNIYTNNSLCCGCGACKEVCPVSAINIKMNEQGFYQSFVENTLCVNCGKCISVCPVQQRKEATDTKDCSLFSYKDNDATVLLESSSGGAAHRISSLLINKGFSIAGCIFNSETQKAEHILVEDEKDLYLFQNSKYMQSDFSKVLEQIQACNKPVAIFGTPCQIASAQKLFSDRKDILYIDLICHGVPSHHLYDKYKQKLNLEYGLNPYKTSIVFRYKPMGWRHIHLHSSDGEKACCIPKENDDYFRMFEVGNCYMKSCYECRYRKFTYADIRLGDYWGPKFSGDTTGVSMVLCATPNGESIVDELKKSKTGFLQEQPIDDYIQYQQMSNLPLPVFYDELIEKLKNKKSKMSVLCDKYAVPLENVCMSKKEHIKYIMKMITFK